MLKPVKRVSIFRTFLDSGFEKRSKLVKKATMGHPIYSYPQNIKIGHFRYYVSFRAIFEQYKNIFSPFLIV